MTVGLGPCCDRGIGGDGSSGSSSRLLRPPKLPSQLAFACGPEQGLEVGSQVVDAVEGEVVAGCSCFVLMGGSKTLFTTRNGFMGGTVATTKRFMGAAFYRRQLEPPWFLTTAKPTERSIETLFTDDNLNAHI